MERRSVAERPESVTVIVSECMEVVTGIAEDTYGAIYGVETVFMESWIPVTQAKLNRTERDFHREWGK